LRSGDIRNHDGALTKEEREGKLKESKGFVDDNLEEAYAIRIQRDGEYLSCCKYALSYGTWACVCDGVEVLTWTRRGQNGKVNSDTELHGGNCIQDARDPFVLPRYSVRPVILKVSRRIRISEETSDL